MRTVKIGDLKAQLSAHIQFVRDGEEVLVCDRDKPVARIVPCEIEGFGEQERRLIARGALIPPRKKRTDVPSPEPVGSVSDDVMQEIWRQEREGR
jgi:antitoxin (DNA-binding transcriptional repressor) of toxin-antitoxin stability system